MSSLADRLFTRTATISRPSLVPAGPGGSTEALAVVATVRCALNARTQRENTSALRIDSVYDHVLYLPIGTDVARGDSFTVDGATDRYRVVEVEDAAYRGHHLEVKCRREID